MDINKVRETFYKDAGGDDDIILIAEHVIEALEELGDRELADITATEIISGKFKISECYAQITEIAREKALKKDNTQNSASLNSDFVYKKAREYFHIDAQYQKSSSALELDFDELFG